MGLDPGTNRYNRYKLYRGDQQFQDPRLRSLFYESWIPEPGPVQTGTSCTGPSSGIQDSKKDPAAILDLGILDPRYSTTCTVCTGATACTQDLPSLRWGSPSHEMVDQHPSRIYRFPVVGIIYKYNYLNK